LLQKGPVFCCSVASVLLLLGYLFMFLQITARLQYNYWGLLLSYLCVGMGTTIMQISVMSSNLRNFQRKVSVDGSFPRSLLALLTCVPSPAVAWADCGVDGAEFGPCLHVLFDSVQEFLSISRGTCQTSTLCC
jgi:hypothetical protein